MLIGKSSLIFLNVFFKKDIVLIQTIFKVFMEFVTILLLFYVSVFWLPGMRQTRESDLHPLHWKESLNHWTPKDVPPSLILKKENLNQYFIFCL